MESALFKTGDQAYRDQVGCADHRGNSLLGKIACRLKTARLGVVAVTHIITVEFDLALDQSDQISRKTLTCNDRILVSAQKSDLSVSETDKMLDDRRHRVDVITADAGNSGVFDVRVHQHGGDIRRFKLLHDRAVQFDAHNHQSAKVVFLTKLFKIRGCLVRAMLDHHLVVIYVGGLLKSRQHGIADLRITVRIHIFKQHANALRLLAAMQ